MPATPTSCRRRAGRPRPRFAHDLGKWGKTRLTRRYYRVEDIVDFIPIGDRRAGRRQPAARDSAWAWKASAPSCSTRSAGTAPSSTSTFGCEWTSVRDPLTGEKRPDQRQLRSLGAARRCATTSRTRRSPGAPTSSYNHYAQILLPDRDLPQLDLPWIVGFYVEDKNVLGLTVRFTRRQYLQRPPPARPHGLCRLPRPHAGLLLREAQRAGRAAVQPVGERHLLALGRRRC